MGRVTCRTHVQPAGYPVQGHRRLSAQSPGYFHLLRVSFAPGLQLFGRPAATLGKGSVLDIDT